MRKPSTVLLIVISLISYAFSVEKPQTETDSCITEECHVEHTSKPVIHDPVSEGSCEACHESDNVKEHTFKLTDEEPGICFQCHDELTKKYVHGALKDGKCSQCHETHSSENKFRLHAKRVGDMCSECHEVAENATHVHGPTSVGECTLCHEAHESDYENRLTMGPDQLCVFCHVTTKEELEELEFVHEAVRENCVDCHDPHGANNWKMLKAETPDMCFPCHEEILAKAWGSLQPHNVVFEQGGCLKCHTPHASSVRYLLNSVPTTLCMTCHEKPQTVTVNKVMPAFIDLKDKRYLHGPVKDEDCSGCHMTHGSDNFRMLAREYPSGFYTSFDETKYELCFGCHEKTLVQTSTTDDLTDFRNGNQNLHFLHVNKERRGRTCRACHQTHASNHPKHIRTSVPYGGWKDLPINFSKTETGGFCDPGCHLAKRYDRQTAVDYTVKQARRTVTSKMPFENLPDVENTVKTTGRLFRPIRK